MPQTDRIRRAIDAPRAAFEIAAQNVFLGVGTDGGRALDVGDVNGDGRPDLVTNDSNSICVLPNLGTPLVSAPPATLPATRRLLPTRPSPASGAILIEFDLPVPGPVVVEVVDVQGRRVRDLLSQRGLAAGSHALTWDGRDAGGSPAPPGVYLIRVASGGGQRVGRAVLLGR